MLTVSSRFPILRHAPPRSSYHHGDLRAALLAAAERLLRSGGAPALTLRALAQEVGVSRTAPYRHFADKEALLVAVAEEGFARLRRQLQLAREGDAEGLRPFEEMGVAYVRFAVENPAHYRLMYGREAQAQPRHPSLQAAADAAYEELVGLIRDGQREGRLRAHPPEQLAYVAWATVHGLSMLLVEGQMEQPEDVEPLARLTTRALLEGLANP